MKTNKLLLTILCLMAGVNAWAYDFEKEGIYYNITDVASKTEEVTYSMMNVGTDYRKTWITCTYVEGQNTNRVIPMPHLCFQRGLRHIPQPSCGLARSLRNIPQASNETDWGLRKLPQLKDGFAGELRNFP